MRQLLIISSLLVVICLLSAGVSAHEIRPAYLQMIENQPGRFEILWKQPVLAGRMLRIRPVFPHGFEALTPPVVSRTAGARVERWQVRYTGENLMEAQIRIDGLAMTLIDVLVRIEFSGGPAVSKILRPESPTFVLGDSRGGTSVSGYLRLGIEHIIFGIDHLLFVLGLLLLSKHLWLLLKTITAFTVGHSISLALATLGFLSVPAKPLGATIALSIVFLGSELIKARQGAQSLTIRKPWLVSFAFGMLHGLGFAGALVELGLSRSAIPAALLFFNVGVEIGQFLFIAVALMLFASFRQLGLQLSRRAEPIPIYAMGSVAGFWFVGRMMDMVF
ncbi:MAG: HupE/UreJ family protein [Deltaproteobacteria bacterium]|nr:HupE/UreJ family protein [Deltaproteobacteria bacterium]